MTYFANRTTHKNHSVIHKHSRLANWTARVLVAFVFAVNVQCALGFVAHPANFTAAYELSGAGAQTAVAGMGITFLMWNCTYPLVIVNPEKHLTLFGIVLAQQLIGLVGESFLLFALPTHAFTLAQSIERFICFDALGLVLMTLGFVLCLCNRQGRLKTKRNAYK